MKNKKIYNLVKSGVQPIVKIKNQGHLDSTLWDNGMLGRIEHVQIEDGDTEFECLKFWIREDSFRHINKLFMNKNYYNEQKIPCLTYLEAKVDIPPDGVDIVYVMSDDETFEIEEKNVLLKEYLEEKCDITYIKWLENKIKNSNSLRNNIKS